MTSVILLLLALAMALAWKGHRRSGLALFTVFAVLALFWFKHHATDHLNLDF